MSLKRFNTLIEKEKTPRNGCINDMQFEKYRRFVEPFSSFVLTLLGCNLLAEGARRGWFASWDRHFHLFCVHCSEPFALVFAIKGGFPATLAVLIPNVVFGILGWILDCKSPQINGVPQKQPQGRKMT
jgi:lipopolysaccharide export system permease protein